MIAPPVGMRALWRGRRRRIPATPIRLDVAPAEYLGAIERSMNVGDEAPDFTLPSVAGPKITLSHLLRSGPAVTAFYRGHW